MDAPALSQKALLDRALETVNGNQAELARRLGRSGTTVNRWVNGQNGIDFESALRLARITDLPASQVLEAAGLDPKLLPTAPPPAGLSPIERDILQRAARLDSQVRELAEATDGVPEDFVEIYVRKVLDRTEDELTTVLSMLRKARERAFTKPAGDGVTRPPASGKRGKRASERDLTDRKQGLAAANLLLGAALPASHALLPA